MKVRLSGDVCHPGMIEIEVKNLEKARELASKYLADEDVEFMVYDEQSDCLLFIPDGTIYDEDGNEIEESDNDA